MALERILRRQLDPNSKHLYTIEDDTDVHSDEHQTAATHAWRAFTVQTLSQALEAPQRIEEHYQESVDDFLQKYGFLIQPELSQRERESLLDVYRTFGNFALQLWSQKYDILYRSLPWFQDWVFMSSAQEMIAARAVKLDDQDRSLDGRPIALVLQPLIQGFGTPDGKEYRKAKVWSKAVVWISRDQHPAQGSHVQLTD